MKNKRKFDEESRILSIRVPASQFDSIKYTMDHYIASSFKGKKDTIIPLQTGFIAFGNIIKGIQEKLRKDRKISKREFDNIVRDHDIEFLNELIKIYIGKIEYSQSLFQKDIKEMFSRISVPELEF